MGDTGARMDHSPASQRARINAALAARLELLSGGISGASTYRVSGLAEPCILKVVEAESAAYVRERGQREIHFYDELAARLPLRVPRVLARVLEPSGYCALLLAAYEPLRPANVLFADEWAEIAAQLARFHAVYWNQTQPLRTFAWLAKPKPTDLTAEVRHARQMWQALAHRPQFQAILPDTTLRAIDAALAAVRSTPQYGPQAALTLCHGDCHLGNLLRDADGRLIWADWQEVGIGYGPSDLSFLLQRAEAAGATLAQDAIVAAYCAGLVSAGVAGVNTEAITSAMRESERRTRLLYWPDYLRDATPEALAQHLARILSV